MKIILIAFYLITLIGCNIDNLSDKQKSNKNISKIIADTCNRIAKEESYYDNQQRFRVIDFGEGKDTFRIVPDTFGSKFNVYLQKKVGSDCWGNVDTFYCRQVGINLKDMNDDGYKDISNELKWWNEINLYNPQIKKFTNKIEIGGSGVMILPNKVRYDIGGYPHSDTSESRLFRFENYKMKIYAKLKLIFKAESQYSTIEKIELYSINNENTMLNITWKQSDFPAFIKNNGTDDYFETHEFIENYWKNNWRKFIPNR
jgi:hypothetical protein